MRSLNRPFWQPFERASLSTSMRPRSTFKEWIITLLTPNALAILLDHQSAATPSVPHSHSDFKSREATPGW